MIKQIFMIVASLGTASCAVHYSGSNQNEGDPTISCTGQVGQALHRCAALATGFSEATMRNFDANCHRRGQHLALSRATGANRQIVVCRHGKATAIASVPPKLPVKRVKTPIDPNSSKAIAFGTKPTALELAKKQGIPQGGGIKQGYVVVVPSMNEWKGVVSRSPNGRAELHVKSIARGDTIAKANLYFSDGKTQLVEGHIPTLPLSDRSRNDACKVILDGTGEPITIREGETGINRYAFYHHINDSKFWYEWRKRQVAEIEPHWKRQAQLLEGLKTSITRNRANQNGQCVTVSQRRIPPAPKRIDPKKVEMNAHGACVNLLGSRFTAEQVIDALEGAGRWDITQNYQKWTFGDKMSCAAGITVSDFESLKTRAIDWLAPSLGKDYFRTALRADLNSCIAQVNRRCDDGYGSWAANKRKIINEPKALKAQCENDKRKLATYDYTAYNEAKRQMDKVLKSRNEAFNKQKPFDRNTFLPFTDKRTYCQLE